MPSAPPCGISTSAVNVYEAFSRLGASPFGVPVSGRVQVKTLRPALRLGRGVTRRAAIEASSGSTWYFCASFQNSPCSSLSFAGFLAAMSSYCVQSFLRS
jgi:hypothetical protein